jgi:prenyl protein peptidase
MALYIVPSHVLRLPRDDPLHVRWRSMNTILYSVVAAPVITLVGVWLMALPSGFSLATQSMLFVSHSCVSPAAILVPFASIFILFSGPLLEAILRRCYDPAYIELTRDWRPVTFVSWVWDPLLVRARVTAPFTEEFVFRCCSLILYHCSGGDQVLCIAGTAAAFGLAHVHHYVERRREGLSHATAVKLIALQFGYTGVFGSIVRVL